MTTFFTRYCFDISNLFKTTLLHQEIVILDLVVTWKVIRRLIRLWKNQCVTTRANELANSILKTVKLLGNDCFPMYLEINEMNNLFCLFWQYCCQAFKQNIFTSVKLCSCYLLNIFINNVIEIYNLTCFLSTLNISFLRYKL